MATVINTTMRGHVRTETCDKNDLESGAIVVYQGENALEICAIMHINPDGNWVITGQTFDELVVPESDDLCKLVILTDHNVYPLKFNQWDKSIKNGEVNSETPVIFELSPVSKFKEGKWIRTCDVCEASFMGGSRQYQCKKCNDTDAVAQIIVKKKVKSKRPRMIAPTRAKQIARDAYGKGYDDIPGEEFEEWLEKQF